jgi:uncharacterized protein (DUF305 family)
MNTKKLSCILAGTAVAGLVLTGCGGGTAATGSTRPGPASAAAQGAHNDADVEFAQGMVLHHRQAVEMAELAAGRTQNPQILHLSARIDGAQEPEIQTMTGWLRRWGAEVPAAAARDADMAGIDHSGMVHGGSGGMQDMGGMMTPEQMQALEQAHGAAFDRVFLQMMVEHHEGAVQMAQTELAEGADTAAKQLAQTITDVQRSEVAEMGTLLQQG